MRESGKKMMFNLIVQTNEEKGTHGSEFNTSSGLNLKTPVLIILHHDGAACMTDDENRRQVKADHGPEDDVESNGHLP